jgi:hypothetical protein
MFAFMTVAACTDLTDYESGPANAGDGTAKVTINVCVSGELEGIKFDATTQELFVDTYDIYVFDGATGALEYIQEGIDPTLSEEMAGSKNIKIGELQVTLPTGGNKTFYAIANRDASNVTLHLPDLLTMEQAEANGDATAVTTLSDFQTARLSLVSNAIPSSPFLLIGSTYVHSSNDASISVVMARQVAKIDVLNTTPGQLSVTSIQFQNVPAERWVFEKGYDNHVPGTAAYNEITSGFENVTDASSDKRILKDKIYAYYTPSSVAENNDDYRIIMRVKGTIGGATPFDKEFYIGSPIYTDYYYRVSLSTDGITVESEVLPTWEGNQFELEGTYLNNYTLTFSSTADPDHGYAVNCITNMSGNISVLKDGAETWYDVSISGKTIRVRTLENNIGATRTATFTVSLKTKSIQVTVRQTDAATINTIMFCGMEWMDRNLEASLPSVEANIENPGCHGAYYQWGRNVAFYPGGSHGTTPAVEGRTPAQANAMTEFILGGATGNDWHQPSITGLVTDGGDPWVELSGSTPAPAGFRVPGYYDMQKIMPFASTNGAYNNATYKTNTGERYEKDGAAFTGVYISNNTNVIYGIKKFGTDEAYVLRWEFKTKSSKNYLKITKINGDASTTFGSGSAAEQFAAAAALFAGDLWDAEILCFPAAGYLAQTNGSLTATTTVYFWSTARVTNNSSSGYSNNTQVYMRANNRGHALPVRCMR